MLLHFFSVNDGEAREARQVLVALALESERGALAPVRGRLQPYPKVTEEKSLKQYPCMSNCYQGPML
jgi:hypothetical protein